MARPPSIDHEAREAARARSETRYVGRPCVRCGSTERFVASACCAPCATAYQKARSAAKPKAPRKTKKVSPVIPFRKSAKLRAARIRAAPHFNGKFIHDLAAADANSPGGRSRSAYLNNRIAVFIPNIVEHAARNDVPRARVRGGANHQYKKVPA
jgi:hypothetical protein